MTIPAQLITAAKNLNAAQLQRAVGYLNSQHALRVAIAAAEEATPNLVSPAVATAVGNLTDEEVLCLAVWGAHRLRRMQSEAEEQQAEGDL